MQVQRALLTKARVPILRLVSTCFDAIYIAPTAPRRLPDRESCEQAANGNVPVRRCPLKLARTPGRMQACLQRDRRAPQRRLRLVGRTLYWLVSASAVVGPPGARGALSGPY